LSFTTIVFDLDGTLIDSAPDLQALLEPTLRTGGRPPLSIEETRQCIGWGMVKLVERAFALTGPPLDPESHDAVIAEFKARYEATDPSRTRVYPGVAETLALLQAGHRIGLCTNKPARATERVLAALGLADFFHGISGGDSLAFRKPDPRHLLDAIRRAGGLAERAVMVGDSETDIEVGRAAGVPIIAVAYGYAHGAPEALGADRVIARFADLPAAVSELGQAVRRADLPLRS
jgi:phosphoglycolate phosphatase